MKTNQITIEIPARLLLALCPLACKAGVSIQEYAKRMLLTHANKTLNSTHHESVSH